MGIGPKQQQVVFSEGADGAAPARPFPKLYGGGAAQVVEVEDGWQVVVVLPEPPPPPPPPAPAAPPDVREIRVPADWEGALVVKDGRLSVVVLEEAPAVVRALAGLVASKAEGTLGLQANGTLFVATLEGSGGINIRFSGSTPVVDATPLLKRIEALEAALAAKG